MKKVLCILISAILIISCPVTVTAAETDKNQIMTDIAEKIITKNSVSRNAIKAKTTNYSTQTNDVIKYDNIDDFIAEVKTEGYVINDLEISKFIMSYTGLDWEGLPDSEILKVLDAKDITISDDYIEADKNGNTSYLSKADIDRLLDVDKKTGRILAAKSATADKHWYDDNGYMHIRTVVHREQDKSSKLAGYQIAAYADWLKMPINYYKDVLTIYHNAKFDSSHEVYGKLQQVCYCCTTKFNYLDHMCDRPKNPYRGNNVRTEYINEKVAAIRFQLINSSAYTCKNSVPNQNHLRSVQSILAYMSYGVVHPKGDAFNVQSGYCHKKLPVPSDISISIINGLSFSLPVVLSKTDYKANPITIFT